MTPDFDASQRASVPKEIRHPEVQHVSARRRKAASARPHLFIGVHMPICLDISVLIDGKREKAYGETIK
jgi:hypothetical protein